MNSPEDEIPPPSEPVLSEEETLRQLRADSVRQYTERIVYLESALQTQRANYMQLYEAVIGEGCCTSEYHNIVAIAKRHREDSNALNRIRIALKVLFAD